MSTDGQRTLWRRNIAENFNRLSRAHEHHRRQTTDRRQTDRRWHIANMNLSSRSLKTKAGTLTAVYNCVFRQSWVPAAVVRRWYVLVTHADVASVERGNNVVQQSNRFNRRASVTALLIFHSCSRCRKKIYRCSFAPVSSDRLHKTNYANEPHIEW